MAVQPTWGESLGQGIRQGFEGFMEAQARARQNRIQDQQLAMQFEQINQAKRKGTIDELELASKTGINPDAYERGRGLSEAIYQSNDPTASREMLPQEQSQALNLYEDFMKSSGSAKKAESGKNSSKIEGDLRGELQGLSKDFFKVRDSYARVQAAGKKPSAAGDLSLIFNYMKILDPGSTVREGEFSNAENSGSVPSRLRAQYNKVISGERLDDSMRKDFIEKAEDLYVAQERNQKSQEKQYRALAERMGASPENVALDLSLQGEPSMGVVPPKQSQAPAYDVSTRIKEMAAQGMTREQIKAKLAAENGKR